MYGIRTATNGEKLFEKNDRMNNQVIAQTLSDYYNVKNDANITGDTFPEHGISARIAIGYKLLK